MMVKKLEILFDADYIHIAPKDNQTLITIIEGAIKMTTGLKIIIANLEDVVDTRK